MPNGNPDPNCQDCKGKGKIDLFTSSSICDCVNKEFNYDGVIKYIGDPCFEIPFNDYYEPKYDLNEQFKIKKTIDELKWSAEQIADGITTWHMWPGICGVTCRGCSKKMNVLGMSYNHWCPLCDPDGKEYVMYSTHDMPMMPHDNPVFGPSIHTIHEGVRIAEARRKK